MEQKFKLKQLYDGKKNVAFSIAKWEINTTFQDTL